MKNPKSKPIRIVCDPACRTTEYIETLRQLAIAESNLVKAGKDSAMPHFIAIVKELEAYHRFHFEQIPDETETPDL